MIKPTVGRVVLFTPPVHEDDRIDPRQPWDAHIVYVWGDRCVNLVAFDHQGLGRAYTSVTLLQDDDAKPEEGRFASWMEYQKGQAAKTEGLEAQLAARNIPENIPAPPPAGVSSPEVPVPPGGFGYLEETLRARAVAPRVSLQDLEAEIASEYWFTAAQALGEPEHSCAALRVLTIWVGVTQHGFTLVGKSAPAAADNFDADIGRRFAREDGMRQLWPLMGFRLRDRLAAVLNRPA